MSQEQARRPKTSKEGKHKLGAANLWWEAKPFIEIKWTNTVRYKDKRKQREQTTLHVIIN